MDRFLSCDWGTSTFRLRLVEVNALRVIAEEKSEEGIANTYQLWRMQTGNELLREEFYISIIRRYIDAMASRLQISLDGTPVILSGMASSSIGMVELPYKQLPFNVDGNDLEIKRLETQPNPYLIISGACTADDVMRGEETKIIGCADYFTTQKQPCMLILPGTHSKHVMIENGKAAAFSTYLTGEFFELLSKKSILAASVSAGGELMDEANQGSFRDGVLAGKSGNLLHQSFMVRTNQVLSQLPPERNYYYLSGLLIGSELSAIPSGSAIVLLSGQTHLPLYTLALDVLGLPIAHTADADEALMNGQKVVYLKYFG